MVADGTLIVVVVTCPVVWTTSFPPIVRNPLISSTTGTGMAVVATVVVVVSGALVTT